jgi:hypothetical protein
LLREVGAHPIEKSARASRLMSWKAKQKPR